LESILSIKQAPNADPTKGKTVVSWDNMDVQQKRSATVTVAAPCPWRKPPEHWVKMNVDGSFYGESGSGGTGMVIRDANGTIIVSACQFLPSCQSPLEAELEACRHGVALSLEWSTLPCVVEMDCSEAVKMITSGELDRSPYTAIIQEIKQLMASCTLIEFELIRREQNNVSHMLANFGRTTARTETWPGSGPVNVPALCRNECNLIT
jgi:ribonuclease HI